MIMWWILVQSLMTDAVIITSLRHALWFRICCSLYGGVRVCDNKRFPFNGKGRLLSLLLLESFCRWPVRIIIINWYINVLYTVTNSYISAVKKVMNTMSFYKIPLWQPTNWAFFFGFYKRPWELMAMTLLWLWQLLWVLIWIAQFVYIRWPLGSESRSIVMLMSSH